MRVGTLLQASFFFCGVFSQEYKGLNIKPVINSSKTNVRKVLLFILLRFNYITVICFVYFCF